METREGLTVSRLFALTMYGLFYRPITAILIAAVTILLPALAAERFLPPAPTHIFTLDFALWSLRGIPIGSVGVIFQAWVAFQLSDGNARVDRIGSVLVRFLPLYVTSVIVGVVSVVGALAFVIPGILWGLACSVVIPVAAIERLGPVDAIRRSFELTRGRRGAIFGCGLAIFVPIAIVLTLVQFALGGGRAETLSGGWLAQVFQALTAMIGASYAGALYAELSKLQPRAEAASVSAE